MKSAQVRYRSLGQHCGPGELAKPALVLACGENFDKDKRPHQPRVEQSASTSQCNSKSFKPEGRARGRRFFSPPDFELLRSSFFWQHPVGMWQACHRPILSQPHILSRFHI